MPYAARLLTDEEKNKQAQNISGGAGANFATGVPGQEPTQKSSGQYTNIQSYLDANKDQAAQMGQNVTSKVDESASNAQSKIQDFATKAPKVEAYDPNEAYKNLGNLNDSQKSQYRDVKATGGYSGPQSIDQVENYNDVQKSYDNAKVKLDNSKNELGQQQLLRDVYNRPQYSAGENKLDQVLLQNNADSRQGFENLSQKYSGLNDMFKNTNNAVNAGISGAKSQAAANQQNLVSAEQEQWNNLINPIQSRADQLNQQNPLAYQGVLDDVSDDTLSDDTLQRLGLSRGQAIWDTNLSSYITPNQTHLGLNDVANSEERSKYKALTDLVQDQSRTQIGDSSAVNTNPLSFDKANFDKDATARETAYKTAYETGKYFPGGATAKQMETIYIPQQQALVDQFPEGSANPLADSTHYRNLEKMKQALADFKKTYGAGRVIA